MNADSYVVPSLSSRMALAKWRMDLFFYHWGTDRKHINDPVLDWYGVPYGRRYCTPLRRYIERQWLVAKTRALVESDRLLMPDGPGALKRVVYKKPEDGPR